MKRPSWPAWWPELSEEEGRSVIGCIALVVAAMFASWIWGVPGALVVVFLVQLYLLAGRVAVIDRAEEASDVADQARSGLEDVKNHLFGLEPPSSGKHGRRAA